VSRSSSNSAMYTQCPKCQTVFRVTLEQLQARDGLVRCGKCNDIFQADQHLYADMAADVAVETPKKSKPAATRRETAAPKKPVKPKPKPAVAPTPPKPAPIEPEIMEVLAAPAPWSLPDEPSPPAPTKEKSAPRSDKRPAKRRSKSTPDTAMPQLSLRPRRQRRSALWIVGGLLLLISFMLQVAYFYRDTLAQYPELQPYFLAACEEIGCSIRPHIDVARIELVEPTGIAPHPRTANALRLRATMVNRSSKPQPFPLMQVTLTDSTGRVLARRIVAPNEYLEQPPGTESKVSGAQMPPNLAIGALLDVANPGGKAVGYQIDFLPPPLR